MKKLLSVLAQLVLFLFVFFAGSLFPPFHIQHVLTSSPALTHLFVADGLILMLALYVLIFIIEAVTKRLRSAALWTTLALILAVVLGLMMKFGFITHEL